MPGNPCSVAICRSNNTRSKGTRFFSFPKDDDAREQWIKRCFSKKPLNYRKMLICSKHFKPNDFEDEMQARLMGTHPRRLKRTAVPSLHILPPENGTMQMLYQTQHSKNKDERIPEPSQKENSQHQQEDTKRREYLATELNINMESFIYEIRQRPEIWEVASHCYSNGEKKNAWDELIDIFIDKTEPSDEEKEHFGQQLQSRWQSIHDTYSRDLKIQKRFGSKKRPVSKFFHRLSFLEDTIASQETTINSKEPQDLSSIPSILLLVQLEVPKEVD